jgi:hypothetical protein
MLGRADAAAIAGRRPPSEAMPGQPRAAGAHPLPRHPPGITPIPLLAADDIQRVHDIAVAFRRGHVRCWRGPPGEAREAAALRGVELCSVLS